MSLNVYEQLADAGIFGPDTSEQLLFENHLARYFERAFKSLLKQPTSLESLGIRTDTGPMSDSTQHLMSKHYDERLEFFESFLDRHYLAYTMAYYGSTHKLALESESTLEEAQYSKFDLITKRAKISGNERILNIGCGFGGLETFLLEKYPGLVISSITPSRVQANFMQNKIDDKSHPLSKGTIEILHGSFDEINLKNRSYDAVFTIGLFEHVTNISYVMSRIHDLLKPNGIAFHHFITSKVVIPKFTNSKLTLIGEYFPGGHIWPKNLLEINKYGLDLENSWFINGMNYWCTLKEWHTRYWSNIPHLYRNKLNINEINHWNKYFSLCKALFSPLKGEFYGNSQYLFRK